MKRIFLLLIIILMACITSSAWAQTSKEEARLKKSAAALDKEAAKPGGEKVVVQRLEKEFNVDAQRIDSLRSQKMGFGETSIVLAMAQKMPGGITDANISRILSMRQGSPKQGWGEISKKLGFKLGPVVSSVDKVKSDSRKDIEKAQQKESRDKGQKMESQSKPSLNEKPAGFEHMGGGGKRGR